MLSQLTNGLITGEYSHYCTSNNVALKLYTVSRYQCTYSILVMLFYAHINWYLTHSRVTVQYIHTCGMRGNTGIILSRDSTISQTTLSSMRADQRVLIGMHQVPLTGLKIQGWPH